MGPASRFEPVPLRYGFRNDLTDPPSLGRLDLRQERPFGSDPGIRFRAAHWFTEDGTEGHASQPAPGSGAN